MNDDTRFVLRAYVQACFVIVKATGAPVDHVFIRNLFIDASPDEFSALLHFQATRNTLMVALGSPDKSEEADALEKMWLEQREEMRARYPEPNALQSVFIERARLTITQSDKECAINT
jgi:hypothetical protein